MLSPSFTRFLSIGLLFSLIGALIFGRILVIQNSSDVEKLVDDINDSIQFAKIRVIPERGLILDRNGKLLAASKEVYEVGIDLKLLRLVGAEKSRLEAEYLARTVARITGADYEETLRRAMIDDKNILYMRLVDGVDPLKAAELRAEKANSFEKGNKELRTLVLAPHLQRSYPEKTLGANVIGYVTSLDPQNPRGVNGVEEKYEFLLAKQAVELSIPNNPYDITDISDLPTGANLILTINREIQAEVEKIIDKAVKANGAKSGTIIVTDPRTGEILAMASTPRIDPNEYWRAKEELYLKGIRWNRAVSQLYEPGSVFKPITISLAIQNGVVTRDTHYFDRGYYDVPGKRITNWDGRAYGDQDMTGCLRYSINTCLTSVVLQLGQEKFYAGLKDFGIGQPVNVDLAGEDYYPLRLPGDTNWTILSLANNAFGQGVAVTPLQMMTALSAIANGGKIMAPHILRAYVDNGTQYDIEAHVVNKPITSEVANEVSNMLADAITGEAKTLKIDGYRIAGKTGTAEVPLDGGGYSATKTNASFVGWGPVDDPHFMIYVWLEEPGGSQPFGSVVAAPVFKDVFLACVQLTNLPPDTIRKQLLGADK